MGIIVTIAREKKTVAFMIKLYCKNKHQKRGLCADCVQLANYAESRLDKCILGRNKPKCADCHIHCYAAPMRDKIRDVMRFSGPRMAIRHPLLSMWHLMTAPVRQKRIA
ncbi:MAG: nitrous oxide-stimulated promoter family protein [Candidatus Omnitrophota bacterium]|nr:nitrous oxide-stimulated promoter family protein [Candidatus Omnitrophota bacterium]